MGIFARVGSFRSIAVAIGLATAWSIVTVAPSMAAEKKPANHDRPAEELDAARSIDGRELFERQWKPGDERSHGGDGLGPMFNEKSCVACHKDGAIGGSGPRVNNALILTPLFPKVGRANAPRTLQVEQQLTALHPGLRSSPSVVLHRFSTTSDYPAWFFIRQGRKGTAGGKGDSKQFPAPVAKKIERLRAKSSHVPLPHAFTTTPMIVSERNTTPLFGIGRFEKVSDQDILAAEEVRFPKWPEVTGRAVRFEDGRVGRFGWKAQQPTLREFVATACAVELGLQVPDVHQSMDPQNPSEDEAEGLDMDDAEVTALTNFIAALDKPGVRADLTDAEQKVTASGRQVFNSVGCAACHRPEIGSLKGAFTDLLVHDMGRQVADIGQSYGGRSQASQLQLAKAQQTNPKAIASPADSDEWRTPPLWGLRDSAPYMHDGRADTIEEAIAWHGGEADQSVAAYFSLSSARRSALLDFLDSLVAPEIISAKPVANSVQAYLNRPDPYSKPVSLTKSPDSLSESSDQPVRSAWRIEPTVRSILGGEPD